MASKPTFLIIVLIGLLFGQSQAHPFGRGGLFTSLEARFYDTFLKPIALKFDRIIELQASTVIDYGTLSLCRHVFGHCPHGIVYYDPEIEKCRCPIGPLDEMTETLLWPHKSCDKEILCVPPFKAIWDPSKNDCKCAINSIPPTGDQGDAGIHDISGPQSKVNELRDIWADPIFWSSYKKFLSIDGTASEGPFVHPRQESPASDIVSELPLPTFVPPPKTDVTPELIQQSLSIQPQTVAVVSSVIPYFADGVISFLIQLDGPIPQTLVLNSSDSLPCDSIGFDPSSNMILVPQTVKNGTPQVVVPTCLIIAINKYDPQWIEYWVQKIDDPSQVFSLLGDNKVHDIDQLDTSVSAALAIRATVAGGNEKRSTAGASGMINIERRAVFRAPCGERCPYLHMLNIGGANNTCGCVFDGTAEAKVHQHRAIEAPDPYTATMSREACAAMKCINNDNRPAMFNPFSLTCWCVAQTFVEVNPSAHTSVM